MTSQGWRAIAVAGALVALTAGCSSSGAGGARHSPPAPSSPVSSPAVPSPPATSGTTSTAAASARCPRVVDQRAGLSWSCVTADLVPDTSDQNSNDEVFSVLLHRAAPPDWGLAEGSAPNYEVTDFALPDATTRASNLLVSTEFGSGAQGPTKVTQTAAHPVRVGTAAGYEVDQLVTLNPAYAAAQQTTIGQEQFSVVLVEVAGKYSLWFVALPDTERRLWSTVPALVAGLRVVG